MTLTQSEAVTFLYAHSYFKDAYYQTGMTTYSTGQLCFPF